MPRPSDPAYWDHLYQRDRGCAWDINAPQPALVQAVSEGLLRPGGPILEIGCGTGDNSIMLAHRGFNVTAIDFCTPAIEVARTRVAAAGAFSSGSVELHQLDLFELAAHEQLTLGPFDTALDSAVLHALGNHQRQLKYLEAVKSLLRQRGALVTLCFSDANPDPWVGPQRMSEQQLQALFSEEHGWEIELCRRCQYVDRHVRAGGAAHALLVLARVL